MGQWSSQWCSALKILGAFTLQLIIRRFSFLPFFRKDGNLRQQREAEHIGAGLMFARLNCPPSVHSLLVQFLDSFFL